MQEILGWENGMGNLMLRLIMSSKMWHYEVELKCSKTAVINNSVFSLTKYYVHRLLRILIIKLCPEHK